MSDQSPSRRRTASHPDRASIPNALSDGPPLPRHRYAIARADLQHFPVGSIEHHPTRWHFPDYLDNPRVPWLGTLKGIYDTPISFPASLSPEAGLLLHALVRNLRPRVALEIGTFMGVSTIWIASALIENRSSGPGTLAGVLHSFDDFGPIQKGPWRDQELTENRLDLVRRRLTEAGVAEVVTLHKGDSSTGVARTRERLMDLGGVQLAFIDGDHSFQGVCKDLWAVEPVLSTGGHVILHDTFPEQCACDGPRQLIDRIQSVATGLYEVCELYLGGWNYGMAVLRRIG